jgi:small-conductance mechanosensitive channel
MQDAPAAPAEPGQDAAPAEGALGDLVPADVDVEGFVPLLIDRGVAMYEGFVKLLPLLAVALLVLLLTWALARGLSYLARKAANRKGTRRSLGDLAATVTRVLVWIFGILTAMTIVFPSVNPAAILSGLGIGGVIIGIAFQDTFQNFMAGVMIMLRRSMRVGDYIDGEGVEGRIEEINLRDTYLRRVDGELVIVPNNHLFANPVKVWTDPDFRRYEVVVGVAYDEDVDEARGVIQAALDALDLGPSGKRPQVFAREFGASSIDFTVRWWGDPEPLGFHEGRDKVVSGIKRALDEAGIEIPFPYRTLTFKEPLRLSQGEGAAQAAE